MKEILGILPLINKTIKSILCNLGIHKKRWWWNPSGTIDEEWLRCEKCFKIFAYRLKGKNFNSNKNQK